MSDPPRQPKITDAEFEVVKGPDVPLTPYEEPPRTRLAYELEDGEEWIRPPRWRSNWRGFWKLMAFGFGLMFFVMWFESYRDGELYRAWLNWLPG